MNCQLTPPTQQPRHAYEIWAYAYLLGTYDYLPRNKISFSPKICWFLILGQNEYFHEYMHQKGRFHISSLFIFFK